MSKVDPSPWLEEQGFMSLGTNTNLDFDVSKMPWSSR